MQWTEYMNRYRTRAQREAKSKEQKDRATRIRWQWLPKYAPDPEDPDVLVSTYGGVTFRKPNTRQQLPFSLP
jgi:hypothetical protein